VRLSQSRQLTRLYNPGEKSCCRFAADAALINNRYNFILQRFAIDRKKLMQTEGGSDVAEPRPGGRSRLTDPHRVKLALEVLAPEFQKAMQLGVVRSSIELLPDKALQQIGVIR
jgi:hypothetical protein